MITISVMMYQEAMQRFVLDKVISYLSAMRQVIPKISTEADGELSVYGGMTARDKKELLQCIKALRVIMNADFNSEIS